MPHDLTWREPHREVGIVQLGSMLGHRGRPRIGSQERRDGGGTSEAAKEDIGESPMPVDPNSIGALPLYLKLGSSLISTGVANLRLI